METFESPTMAENLSGRWGNLNDWSLGESDSEARFDRSQESPGFISLRQARVLQAQSGNRHHSIRDVLRIPSILFLPPAIQNSRKRMRPFSAFHWLLSEKTCASTPRSFHEQIARFSSQLLGV